MLQKLNWRCVLFLVTAVLGIVWVVLGFGTYGFWSEAEGPGAGFFPAIIGCVLTFFSIIELIKIFRNFFKWFIWKIWNVFRIAILSIDPSLFR